MRLQRLAGILCAIVTLAPGPTNSGREWRYYGGDPGSNKYSPLDQINKSNVSGLKPAWILDTGD